MRHAYLLNATALLLLIPLILLAATYQSVASSISNSQSERTTIERQYFQVSNIQTDLQNTLDLSFKRAYLTLTEYVISKDFVSNASQSLSQLIMNGTINNTYQSSMGGITLKNWFNNLTKYLTANGFRIIPNSSSEFLSKHVFIQIAPLDSFHVALRAKLINITITDSTGRIVYKGDIPFNDYVYSIVSISGMEDPFVVRMLNGLYTRVIKPCSIPYPGDRYGYYNVSDSRDIDELALNWCYVGLYDNNSTGVYYPTVLERFEREVTKDQHNYYLHLAEVFQKALGMKPTPVGLTTFIVPNQTIDPALIGAIQSVGGSIPQNYDSVDYYFLKCAVQHENCDITGEPVSQEQPRLHLDNYTKKALFDDTAR